MLAIPAPYFNTHTALLVSYRCSDSHMNKSPNSETIKAKPPAAGGNVHMDAVACGDLAPRQLGL